MQFFRVEATYYVSRFFFVKNFGDVECRNRKAYYKDNKLKTKMKTNVCMCDKIPKTTSTKDL